MIYSSVPNPGYVAEGGDPLVLPNPALDGLDGLDSIGRDLDPAGVLYVRVGGVQNLQNALIRRLRCRRGYLPHHPGYGSRLFEFLGTVFDVATILDIRDDVAETLEQDPRVLSILSLSVVPDSDGVTVNATVMTPLGPVSVNGEILTKEA